MRKIILVLLLLIVSIVSCFAVTKKAIKLSELPAAITTDISKRYLSYTIVEAYKVINKNIITFEVIIQSKENRSIVYFDSQNKFIRWINVPYSTKKALK